MDIQPQGQLRKVVSLAEYASELASNGARIQPGSARSFWLGHESGAIVRIPTFYMASPAPNEVRRVLWRGRAAVVSYLREPDERHPANAWLYTCSNKAYALDKLSRNMRRDVRRGSREFRIMPVTPDQLLTRGAQAFCDTRCRVGLSDGTHEEFHRRFSLRGRCLGHVFLGAWKDDTLAAFLSITEVDDWAEIEGSFSMDALLNLTPNEALLFNALSRYLHEGTFGIVSYGLSSIQAESNAAGLHFFKRKVGFEARPVHRALVLHPLLQPFVNRLTLWGVNMALHLRPGDRRLKKASGMLACMLGAIRLPEMAERKMPNE